MDDPEIVFLDVGGTLYDDAHYHRALLTTIRELGGRVEDEEFDREYERWRARPGGSFRQLMAKRFLGEDVDLALLEETMRKYWHYPEGALMPGAMEALRALEGRYRLGIIADQEVTIRQALRRDGVEPFIDVWCISAEIGMEKPDPRVFALATSRAGLADPADAVMVGDRLDDDMRPAREVGMRTVWVLTGKAPPNPTPAQLAEPDVWIRGLAELPDAVERLPVAIAA